MVPILDKRYHTMIQYRQEVNMSDKYVTIGIKATKDVRAALDMLQKELPGAPSLKALFEEMLLSYGCSLLGFFKREVSSHAGAIEESKKEKKELESAIAAEASKEKKDELFLKLETINQTLRHHEDNLISNTEKFYFYERFLSTAFPDKDAMFRD